MRRKDREMPEEFAYMVANKCEWAVFAMIDTEGMPYCVPITIALDGKTVYFHSGPEGYKVDALRKNNAVCISCVGDTYRTPDKFTTEFESAIIRGRPLRWKMKKSKSTGFASSVKDIRQPTCMSLMR